MSRPDVLAAYLADKIKTKGLEYTEDEVYNWLVSLHELSDAGQDVSVIVFDLEFASKMAGINYALVLQDLKKLRFDEKQAARIAL